MTPAPSPPAPDKGRFGRRLLVAGLVALPFVLGAGWLLQARSSEGLRASSRPRGAKDIRFFECKLALQSWRIAQGTYHAERDVYDPVFAKVDFPMERGNRYTYFAGRGPVELRDTTPSVGADTATVIGADTEFLKQQKDSTESLVAFEQLPPGVQAVLGMTGTCPQCQISAACAANLDDDDTLDVWVISTGPLPLNHADGKPSEPDSVIHVVDDQLD